MAGAHRDHRRRRGAAGRRAAAALPPPLRRPRRGKPLRGRSHPRLRQHPRRSAGHAAVLSGWSRCAGRAPDRRFQGLLVLRHRPRRPAAGGAVTLPARVGVAAGARARLVHHPAPDARRRTGRCGQPTRGARPLRTLSQRPADPGARGARLPRTQHRRRHRRAGRPRQRLVRHFGHLRAGGAGGGAARVRSPPPAVRHRLPDLTAARPGHHHGQRLCLGGYRSRRAVGLSRRGAGTGRAGGDPRPADCRRSDEPRSGGPEGHLPRQHHAPARLPGGGCGAGPAPVQPRHGN